MSQAIFPDDPEFPDDPGLRRELDDLDFALPADFHVPDDLSELDSAPPPLVHEDTEGNEWQGDKKIPALPGALQDDLPPTDFVDKLNNSNSTADFDLEAEFKAFTGETRELALLLTPVLDARPLAAVLALVKVDADCIPTPTGAVVVLKDKDGDQPITAAKLLSQALAQTSVLLVTKASGQLSAERYQAGKCEGEVPAGLLVAGASGVVEDLLVGLVKPEEIPGLVSSVGVSRAKAMMWLGASAGGRSATGEGGSGNPNQQGRQGHRGLWRGKGRPE